MARILLQNVGLDYVIKTGTDSIKKTAVHVCNKWFNKNQIDLHKRIFNSSFPALSHLTLSIEDGDRIGLLGKNGAGKSTLLKVLAKVYRPSCGSIAIQGKVSTLFDVNLGLNPEATGYENIINLAIMRGFSRKQAQKIIPDIEAFTELGDFLARPVRAYSAGMQMKLVFAVATTMPPPPEIMLIDEVIGVGDIHFMERATARLTTLINQSCILVMASHSHEIIKRFCNKVIVMEHGQVKYHGNVEGGIDYYEQVAVAEEQFA